MFTLVILSAFRHALIHPLLSSRPERSNRLKFLFLLSFSAHNLRPPFCSCCQKHCRTQCLENILKKMVDILSAVLNPWKASQCRESIKERHTMCFSNVNSIGVFSFNTRSKNMKRKQYVKTLCQKYLYI